MNKVNIVKLKLIYKFTVLVGLLICFFPSSAQNFGFPTSPVAGCSALNQSLGLCTPKVCTNLVCFANEAAKSQYENDNQCKFASAALCGDKPIDNEKQCCTKDAANGQAKIKDKQISALDTSFNWDDYKKECSTMKQSQSTPDGLWAQCRVGERHSASDDYVVVSVIPNGNSRSYCIDGCSTPPGIVSSLANLGYFIFKNKDNPTGAGPNGYGSGSSFFNACANHDKCYQTCDQRNQSDCDNQLLADSLAVCNTIPANHITTFINNLGFSDDENTRDKCISAANKMNTGLTSPLPASKAAFKMRRQQYCQCC